MFPVYSETLELDPPKQKPDQYLWEARGNLRTFYRVPTFQSETKLRENLAANCLLQISGRGRSWVIFSSYSGIRIYQSRSNDKTEVAYLARRSLGVSFMSSSKTCFMTPSGHSLLLFRSVIPCKLWNIWFLHQELTEIKRKIGMFSSWQSKT